ncbi:MAG: hypothetical protein ABFD51_13120 [Anaerolineaceae bacterium]
MIKIDTEDFNIPIVSITRRADFLDKYAERTEDGKLHREIIGVYFNYQITFGRGVTTTEYARLWEKLTEPVEFHSVVVPDEDGDYTFTAYFSNVGDQLVRAKDGTSSVQRFWRNLTVNFIAQEPART